jgi:hypothetical protein
MKTHWSSARHVALLGMSAYLGLGGLACGPVLATQPTPLPPQASGEGGAGSDLVTLEGRIRNLEESLPLLACGPELRALIHHARQVCNNKQPAAPKGGQASGGECNERDIKLYISMAERDLETNSIGLKLLSVLRHETVYPRPDGKIGTKREERLKALAKESLLPSTKFLLVAGGPDAMQRIDLVHNRLLEYGVKDHETMTEGDKEISVDRFEKPWNVRLKVPLQQLRLVDRPIPPTEPRDQERAVYVFRTDCP